MGETTQAERLYLDQMTADFDETDAAPISTRLLRKLLNDADRLAESERRARELAGSIREDAGDPDGNPARTYRAGFDNGYYSGRTKSANELERLIDAPEEESSDG